MVDTMKGVQKHKETVSAAARKYKVPRRTLADRIKGRVQLGINFGPSTVLTKEEEDALIAYLIYTGFFLTAKMTTALTWAIAMSVEKSDRFLKKGPRRNWFTHFENVIHNFLFAKWIIWKD